MFRIELAMAAIFITPAALALYTLAPHTAAAQGKAPAAEAVIGHYRFESGNIYSVEKSRNDMTLKVLGQDPQTLKGSPERGFSYGNGAAHLTFDFDPKGVADTLHVHFDNKTLPAVRVDAAAAKKAADDFAAKIKNQTHDPECEQTLRRAIEELRAGKPEYSKMTLLLAAVVRQQLPELQQRLNKGGAVKEVKFKGVGSPSGREKFDVTFERGRSEWRIQCLANGWIGNMDVR